MRVIRDGEVLYSSASGCGASNADDCGCGCKDEYSNLPGKPTEAELAALQAELKKRDEAAKKASVTTSTSNSDRKGINPDLLSAGTDIFTQLGTALIGRQRTYTDVEQKCGKKPKTGKKAKEAWQKCASSADLSSGGAPLPTGTSGDTSKPGMSKGAKIGIAVGGLAIIGLVIYLVAKSGKSKGK